MKRKTFRKGAAVGLSLMILIHSAAGRGIAPLLTSYADERPAVVSASTLNVRSGPGTSNSVVAKLTNGTSVTVLSEANGSDGMVWYQIRFSGSGGAAATGYARSDYIRFPSAYTADSDFEGYLNAQGFPDSYKPGLRQLHAMYPNWVFTAQHTNLDWDTVIENEALVGRNLVYNGSISSWKSTADGAYDWETGTWPSFDSGNYVAASDALIRYYMDPRNFLDDMYVFQFLLHSYDASNQTAEGLRGMVKGTFLSGSASVSGGSGSGSSYGSGSAQGPGSTGGPGWGASGSGSTGGPGAAGTGNSGASRQSPGGSGTGGSSGTGSGASTQAPGGSGTGSGASTQAPGGSGTGSGASTQAPGGSGTGSGASTQAPGGSGTGSGASTQAPGGSGNTGNGNSGVSRQAPGSVASAGGPGLGGRFLGTVSAAAGSRLLLMTMAPGMVTGPGSGNGSENAGSGDTGSVPGSSLGPGYGLGSGASGGSGSSGSAGGAPAADYVDIIMDAGAKSGVNPYVLAAMILQEQGVNGNGRSISGTVPGYTGYYNFFNVEAYQSGGMDAVTRGLWYASQSGSYNRPWNSVDRSIIGGAIHYGTNYVQAGQNTFYLKKFNVQGQNLYKHQYMTNVQAAASEGAKLAEAYGDSLKNTALAFQIPVYRNMPSEACPKPAVDGSPNNKLSYLGVDGFALTPTFNRDTTVYDLIVDSSVEQVLINASAYSSSAVISGSGAVDLQGGTNEIVVSVKAQNGDVRQYVIRVVRQQNGPTHDSSLNSGSGKAPGGSAGPGGTMSSGGSAGPGGTTSSGGSAGPGGTMSSGNGSSGSGEPGSSGPASGGGAVPGGGPGGSNVTIVQ